MTAGTSMLRLIFRSPERNIRHHGLPCDVIDIRGPLVHELSVTSGTYQDLPLEPGIYIVRVPLPGGSRIERQVTLAEGADVVQIPIDVPDILHAGPLRSYLPGKGVWPRPSGPWVCLWSQGTAVRWQPSYVEDVDGGLRFGLRGLNGTHDLQVGGGEAPSRMIALPPVAEVHVGLRYRADDPSNTPIAATVQGPSSTAVAIMGYLAAGRTDLAERVADVVVSRGEPPRDDEDLALACCYLALRLNRHDLLADGWRGRDTGQSRSDWETIAAWRTMADQAGETNDPDQLVDQFGGHLLRACAGEAPRYAEGLRLLYLGLKMVSTSRQVNPADGTRASDALADVQQIARRCDWNQPTTTLVGVDPDSRDLSFALPDRFAYLLPTPGHMQFRRPFTAVVPVESALSDLGLAAQDDRLATHRPPHLWRLFSPNRQSVASVRVRSFHSDAPLEVRAEQEGQVVTSRGLPVGGNWMTLELWDDVGIAEALRNQLLLLENPGADSADYEPEPDG